MRRTAALLKPAAGERKRLPRLLVFTDPQRTPNLEALARALPRGAALVYRSFGAPDPSLTGSIDRLALERAVAALPAGYRLIFVLHDVEGFEHNEIAAMLDCSVGNSKSQLHKARLKLRDALRQSLRKGGKR